MQAIATGWRQSGKRCGRLVGRGALRGLSWHFTPWSVLADARSLIGCQPNSLRETDDSDGPSMAIPPTSPRRSGPAKCRVLNGCRSRRFQIWPRPAVPAVSGANYDSDRFIWIQELARHLENLV